MGFPCKSIRNPEETLDEGPQTNMFGPFSFLHPAFSPRSINDDGPFVTGIAKIHLFSKKKGHFRLAVFFYDSHLVRLNRLGEIIKAVASTK